MIGYVTHSPHIGNRQNDSATGQGVIDIGNAATTKNCNNYSNTKSPPKSLPKIFHALQDLGLLGKVYLLNNLQVYLPILKNAGNNKVLYSEAYSRT